MLLSIGFGQTLLIQHEYKADPGLIDILIKSDSSGVTPKTFVYRDCFRDLSPDKSTVKLLPSEEVVISENNRLLGVFHTDDLPAAPTEPQNFQFTLYSKAAQPLYSLHDKAVRAKRRPSFFINDRQQVVVQVSAYGDQLKFYDYQGLLLREKRLTRSVPHNYEFPEIRFSKNSNCMALLTRVRDSESGELVPMFYLLSPIGEELWHHQLVLDRVETLAISPSGNTVVAAGATYKPLIFQARYQTFIFDNNGSIKHTLPYHAEHLLMDSSEDNLLMADKQTIRIVNLKSNAITVLKNIGSGRSEIADIGFLNDSSFAVSAGVINYLDGVQIYDNPEISVITKSGVTKARYTFRNEYTFRGKVYPVLSGEQLGFALNNRFVMLQFHP
jgi:hypothetical protein